MTHKKRLGTPSTPPTNNDEHTSTASSRSADIDSGGSAAGYSQTETIVQRCTPILFSTNRGLNLRVTKPLQFAASTSSATAATLSGAYDIRFCDLERWSTKRANNVSLEDTIVSTHTFTTAIPPSQRSSFIPLKRFNNTFSRFDESE